jgi:hypothetical protein
MTKDYSKLLGNLITIGTTREVYNHRTNDKYIIKVQTGSYDYGYNLREWIIWKKCKKYRYLLVPCIEISQCSLYLVMLKGRCLTEQSEVPKNRPIWLGTGVDVGGLRQWVKIDDKILLTDYAHHLIWEKLIEENILNESDMKKEVQKLLK